MRTIDERQVKNVLNLMKEALDDFNKPRLVRLRELERLFRLPEFIDIRPSVYSAVRIAHEKKMITSTEANQLI